MPVPTSSCWSAAREPSRTAARPSTRSCALELLLPRARQDLRREILPLEQVPEVVKAASRVLQGTNLSIYGEGGQLIGQLAPFFDILTRAVSQATRSASEQT